MTIANIFSFLFWAFRPRAIRAYYRLGNSFECFCWMCDFWDLTRKRL